MQARRRICTFQRIESSKLPLSTPGLAGMPSSLALFAQASCTAIPTRQSNFPMAPSVDSSALAWFGEEDALLHRRSRARVTYFLHFHVRQAPTREPLCVHVKTNAIGIGPACMPCSREGNVSLDRQKASCIRKCMRCNCLASCRTKGRTGQSHAAEMAGCG